MQSSANGWRSDSPTFTLLRKSLCTTPLLLLKLGAPFLLQKATSTARPGHSTENWLLPSASTAAKPTRVVLVVDVDDGGGHEEEEDVNHRDIFSYSLLLLLLLFLRLCGAVFCLPWNGFMKPTTRPCCTIGVDTPVLYRSDQPARRPQCASRVTEDIRLGRPGQVTSGRCFYIKKR